MVVIFTIILLMGSGKYHIGLCTDPLRYIRKRKEEKRGFFNQKNNGFGELVFLVRGNYRDKIRSFGAKRFMQMIKDYDPVFEGLHHFLT